MARPGWKLPQCSKCDDGGAVMLDRRVVDKHAPDGYRVVVDAYRCDCPAGERRHPSLPLAPRIPPDLAGSISRHPSQAAPEGLAAKADAIGRRLGLVKPEQTSLEDDEPF